MQLLRLILMVCSLSFGFALTLCGAEGTALFNGKDLTGWETFLRPANKADPDYGLNRDPEQVFAVEKLDSGAVIHISGKYWGGMITTRDFENYHLRLEFKWGQKTWPPRYNLTRDSGLLYHCAAPSADAKYAWPRSIEFNITEHDTGEFWSVEDTIGDAEVVSLGDSPDELAAFKGWCQRNEADGPKVKFQKGGRKQTFRDGGFMPGGDFEKVVGEWNVLDLYAVGDQSVHLVNGKVALVLTGLRMKQGTQEFRLTKGRIELQSESAEIYFRNIQIQAITQIPAELLK